MNKYSQKPTKTGKGSTANTNSKVVPYNHDSTTRTSRPDKSSTTNKNKFEGMAKNIEKIEAIIIPGYKVRG